MERLLFAQEKFGTVLRISQGKMFGGKRFNLLKQRMVGGGEAEPVALKALKKEVFMLKVDLTKIRKGQ